MNKILKLLLIFGFPLLMTFLFTNFVMSNLSEKIEGEYHPTLLGGYVSKKMEIGFDCNKKIDNISKDFTISNCNANEITLKNNANTTSTIDRILIPIKLK